MATDDVARGNSPALVIARICALLLLAGQLLLALPPAISRAVYWIREAGRAEDAAAVRRRVFGDPWVDGMARARAAIPVDGDYLLVNGETTRGPHYWVRYELAPRRAVFLGTAEDLRRPDALRQIEGSGPEWVVIAFRQPRPPALMRREDLRRALNGGAGAR